MRFFSLVGYSHSVQSNVGTLQRHKGYGMKKSYLELVRL